ncbi:MAG: hypothetical protein ABSE53_00695 [Terracidiphilus sp.]
MATGQTRKCPISITILSWLYILVGVLGTAAHYADFKMHKPIVNEFVWITALGVAAVVAGILMLRGQNWARWLALVWIASHVVISAFHPLHELIMHCALLVLFSYLLFRREAREYFNAG